MKPSKSILLTLLLPLILYACASFEPPYVSKGYEEVTETGVAIIKGTGFIDMIMHKDVKSKSYVEIYNAAYQPMHTEFRLAPGNYCVFYSSYIRGKNPIGMGCFDLISGHKYRVDVYIKSDHNSRIWFEDMTSGQIISDVG